MHALKVLAVTEFDAVGVLAGWKRAVAPEVDLRIAVHKQFARHGDILADDWVLGPKCHFPSLWDFARRADVIQFHPAIGQPWSVESLAPRFGMDADTLPYGPIEWARIDKPKIALFHGSRNAAANAEIYSVAYRKRGMHIWATTLDYVARMAATYTPPILPPDFTSAKLRQDHEPLIVAHAPTDPENCQTRPFIDLCARLGTVVKLLVNQSHAEVLATKAKCNAGFDHLRGAFSINTLENARAGLVTLVGLKPEFMGGLSQIGATAPVPALSTLEELEQALINLESDPERTRIGQRNAALWFTNFFTPWKLGPRLVELYKEVAR
jgi:hypothetical protein